jgi:hypothetical protein
MSELRDWPNHVHPGLSKIADDPDYREVSLLRVDRENLVVYLGFRLHSVTVSQHLE